MRPVSHRNRVRSHTPRVWCLSVAVLGLWTMADDALAQNLDGKIANAVSNRIAARVEDNVAAVIGERIAAQIDNTVADTVADQVAAQIGDAIANTVGDQVAAEVNDGIANAVGQHLATRADGTAANAINTRVAANAANEMTDRAATGIVRRQRDRDFDRAGIFRARIRRMRITNPDLIDLDPMGAPVLRREIIAISPTRRVLNKIEELGFEVVSRDILEDFGITLVRLRAPVSLMTIDALDRLRSLDPDGQYDFNHIYFDSGDQGPAGGAAHAGIRPPAQAGAIAKTGIIDGGIAIDHPSLRHVSFVTQAFAENPYTATDHGTAVAFLMAGQAPHHRAPHHRAPAPGVQIISADVFGGNPAGGTAFAVAQAFGWLARQDVALINASLAGPHNLAVQVVIERVLAQDRIIVAAVGNDGPYAPPLYPAAYDGVFGVTAVDGRNALLLEAARGAHVDVAALGADMIAASANGKHTSVRGTSFAAPIVTGFLAANLDPGRSDRRYRAERLLTETAIDLGPKGRDTQYGLGLIGGTSGLQLSSAR